MAAKYPYYLLADSPEGIKKERELTGTLTPALSQRERESYGGVVQLRFARTLTPALSQKEMEKDREAIRRLNLAIPEEVSATHKESLSVRTERRLNP